MREQRVLRHLSGSIDGAQTEKNKAQGKAVVFCEQEWVWFNSSVNQLYSHGQLPSLYPFFLPIPMALYIIQTGPMCLLRKDQKVLGHPGAFGIGGHGVYWPIQAPRFSPCPHMPHGSLHNPNRAHAQLQKIRELWGILGHLSGSADRGH